MKIRAGLGLAAFPFDAPRDFFAFAERCEAAGVDSLWQTDRLHGESAQLEALAAMATLAGSTSARGGNGVISIHTRNGGSGGNSMVSWYDKSMLQPIRKAGFSATKKFSSPDYSTPENTTSVPDYRSTIYWNPSVITDEKKLTSLSFFAADLPTQYRIVVEGVTSAGKAVRGEKILMIRKLP